MTTSTLNPEDHERAANELRNGSAQVTSSANSPLDDLRTARHEKDEWDRQIEEDAEAGKLDDLMEEARRDHRRGNTQPLP